ncbi:cytochrome P450 3A9-like isoform X2 [Dreissena polymorpha]|uniref:cytochrome P450 3A9-like isoform X2 n=1 Tax=Dreissena polymorpha TaxID=45954 RepID=UPI0022646440|nr:cytochrome P450 3A9-like isoform X2 [Dreissena polymorpha]
MRLCFKDEGTQVDCGKWYTWYKQSLFRRLGIPTKKTVFLLGDFVDMLKEGFSYISMDLYKKHGKVFGLYTGNKPTMVISDPDIIKHIMVKDFEHFTDRPQFIMLSKFWRSAMSFASGDAWRNIRHTLSPSFTSGKMRNMTPYLHRCLDIFHGLLEKNIEEHPQGFDIDPMVRCYTMDVICATSFGLEVSAQTDLENPFIKHSKEFLDINPSGNPLFIIQILFPELANAFPKLFESNLVAKHAIDFFKNASISLFEDRKKSDANYKDLLQLMVNANKQAENEETSGGKRKGLTDDEILTNSVTFMVGAYDTTAATIVWILYEMALHQDLQQKLVDEIEEQIGEKELSYDNVFTMRYVDMVMSETLRMHPPNTRLGRQPDCDIEICGVKIPKGMDCTISTDIVHFLEEYWEDPYTFNPERFSPENKSKINEYAYLPVRGGAAELCGYASSPA